MKEFSKVLKELRNGKGITQEALANAIHVSRSAIAKYESGLGLPSDEVAEAICSYFGVNKEYLFPKENIEQLITEKNIVINKQKKMNIVCLVLLVVMILFVIILFSFSNIGDESKNIVLNDTNVNIDINKTDDFQKEIVIFQYSGGYVYQRLEIHKISFTSDTNLYLLRVNNTYVNGYMASQNDESGFDKNEYTKKAYMGINFNYQTNVKPIVSWQQTHSKSFYFTTQFGEKEILFDGKTNLFDGAELESTKYGVLFSYDCKITDWLFDSEYNILRKCKISNDLYNPSWEYQMENKISETTTFTISSSYLFEATPNQIVNFTIETSMENKTMSIRQKRIFNLMV